MDRPDLRVPPYVQATYELLITIFCNFCWSWLHQSRPRPSESADADFRARETRSPGDSKVFPPASNTSAQEASRGGAPLGGQDVR